MDNEINNIINMFHCALKPGIRSDTVQRTFFTPASALLVEAWRAHVEFVNNTKKPT